jgi:hypothetical protein
VTASNIAQIESLPRARQRLNSSAVRNLARGGVTGPEHSKADTDDSQLWGRVLPVAVSDASFGPSTGLLFVASLFGFLAAEVASAGV